MEYWTIDGVSATSSSLVKRSGNKSILIGTKTTSFSNYLKQRISGVNGGKQYKVTGHVKKGNNLNEAKIRIGWYKTDQASQMSRTDDSNIIGSDDWSLLEVKDVNPPEGANDMEIRLTLRSVSSGQEAFAYFDDIAFEEYDLPTPTLTATNTPIPTSINIVPSNTSTPSHTPTPKKTPTPSRAPTPTRKITVTPVKKIVKTNKNSGGEILGEKASTSTSSNFTSDQSDEFVQIFILVGVLFGAASVAAYFYNKFQTPIDKFIRRKFKRE